MTPTRLPPTGAERDAFIAAYDAWAAWKADHAECITQHTCDHCHHALVSVCADNGTSVTGHSAPCPACGGVLHLELNGTLRVLLTAEDVARL